jgi:hypothetical protein
VIEVILLYPDGDRRDALLREVPRVGEHIRLADADSGTPSLEVEDILWVEGSGRTPEPTVIVSVRSQRTAPRR